MPPRPPAALTDQNPVQAGARELLLVFAVCLAALFVIDWAGPAVAAPRADALRYLTYAVNLMQHGVFGLDLQSGQVLPGRANTPLYPAFGAAVFVATGVTSTDLACFFGPDAPRCVALLQPLLRVQLTVAATGLVCIWLTALRVLGSRHAAWVAVLCALLSGQPSEFARQVLTENLTIPLFALLTLALCGVRAGAVRWYAVSGVTLGLLILTRPEFLYLGVAALLLQSLRTAVAGAALRPHALRACAVLVAGTVVIVGPWLMRNQGAFADPGLTSTYAGQTLAQRVQYNRMSMQEFACAFVFWLPDFGDSLARSMLPAACYRRLGFGPGSYYADGLMHYQLRAREAGSATAVMGRLLREDVLQHPLRHARSTIALAWRGLFVGKLWGLLAVVAVCVVLATRPRLRRPLIVLGAPACFMLLLYAAVSVAIPRYAVCFIPVFSLALAAFISRRRPSRTPRSDHAPRGG